MHILVLNGSPKGPDSTTLQTVHYLAIRFPAHTFEILHAGQRIGALSRDFSPAAEALSRGQLILFCYPVYTFMAPSQLHHFIRLLRESGIDLRGKFAAQITTSKHFYDVTAHGYIRDNCFDLGLRYLDGLSADMDDLLCPRGRKEAEDFFRSLLWSMEEGLWVSPPPELPAFLPCPVTLPPNCPKAEDHVVLVTDCRQEDTHLSAMIQRFLRIFPRQVQVVNLWDFPFRGGCLGCFRCAPKGNCIYQDGFDTFLREKIQSARAIVYAFTIEDHSMGHRFKLFDDRQFCNGHRMVTVGMPVGYLISGPLSREENLRFMLRARAQVGRNILAGAGSDEENADSSIDAMARRLDHALTDAYLPPQNFLGVGGMKIFRDLIWLMQGLMKADHQFYKAHKQYDFPQKRMGYMLKMRLAGSLFASPRLQKKLGSSMTEGILMPYRKVLEQAKKDASF